MNAHQVRLANFDRVANKPRTRVELVDPVGTAEISASDWGCPYVLGVQTNSSGIFNNLSIITMLINIPKKQYQIRSVARLGYVVLLFRQEEFTQKQKKLSIGHPKVIEKLRLFARRDRTNLKLFDSSDTRRVTNPGKTGSNHLLPSYWRRFISPVRSQMAWALCPPPAPVSSTDRGFFMLGIDFSN